MNRSHGAFTEQFLNKTWTMNMDSTAHSYSSTHDIQDFNTHFNDVTMSFPDLESNDLPSYITETVQDNHPDVSSTLSPYQDLESYHEVNLSVEHTNSAVPSISPYPGDHNFQVTVQKQTKETKSVNWIYSEGMGKLYVRINVPCPFLFRTSHPPPLGSLIRATPIFWNPEHVNEVVKRCPTHMAGSQNEPRAQVKHLLTSDHREAKHLEDPLTRRLCVLIPHEEPQVGSTWVTSLFRFMCFSSCHGGYNRRPLHVIFTLEHDNQVIGRQVMKVRLCACPGRDWDIETKPKNKKKKGHSTSLQGVEVTPTVGQSSAKFKGQENSPRKRKKADKEEEDDDDEGKMVGSEEMYTLQVKGKVNFNILRKLRDSLHLFSLFRKDNTAGSLEIQTIREYQPPKQCDSNATNAQQQQQQLQQLQHFQQHQPHFSNNNNNSNNNSNNNNLPQIVLQQNQAISYYQQLSY